MELKLKNDEPQKKVNSTPQDLSDDYIEGKEDLYSSMAGDNSLNGSLNGTMYTNNPVRITSTASVSASTKSSSGFDLMGVIKWVVIAVIAIVGIKFVYGLINPEIIDVSSYVNMDAEELAKKLDVTFEKDCDMNKMITHYSNGTVTVDGDGEIGVVYIDGKRKGIHINDKKYSMYGVSIGDGEFKIDDNMTYEYDESFNVLDDMLGGKSTAIFYYNKAKNDCFVVVINDRSARVVAMTYFNDYKLITQNLSGIEE